MKLRTNYVCIPVSIFENTQLSILEKWLLVTIDALPQDVLGVNLRPGAIATAFNLPKKDVVAALNSLYKKGAIQISIDEDGSKLVKAIFKDDYILSPDRKPCDDPKQATDPLPWDEIMEKWNTLNPNLPQVTKMTPLRKRKLRTLLQKNGATLADLYKAFEIVSTSEFLQQGTDGAWAATLDWLILDNKGQFQKTLDGAYSRSYSEKAEYERIISGQSKKSDDEEDFYR